MSTNNPPGFFEKLNHHLQHSITIKLLVIGLLILILMIPLGMIEGLIHERTYRQNDAKNEVAASWSEAQRLGGPVLSIPYTEFFPQSKTSQRGWFHVLPAELNIDAVAEPSVRERGIFKIPVYESQYDIQFAFEPMEIPAAANRTYHFHEATIDIGITDPRGISEDVVAEMNNNEFKGSPGVSNTNVYHKGVHFDVPSIWNDSIQPAIKGHLELSLKGTDQISFVPSAKSTSVNIQSTWPHPSFNGRFLPENREYSDDGFTANWNILEYNRSTPQSFLGAANFEQDAFGVSLYSPVNHYQKSERSAKYAVMLIALTFILFFFSQAINKVKIHPFQYFLVGLALCLFYTLLLSLSEHIGFNKAYVIAASMVLSMVGLYLKQIFQSVKFTLITTGVLAGLYVYIFSLLQLEDYALLIGSIGLFVILALIMWLSLKIKWGGQTAIQTED